ncbi:SOS response-associated peptidase [Aldersonia sp. NBC_00410]|uniref:SOS response-associated peptidase n=1 Tax=Aldersonia sp. NBC_00410 TaxID=2975954 RepID=UPI00224FF367|nr:SOS response-associated peptidase [Aldersonia sp. NBC_00410]MCX5044562.1 SOS response-associated peptidase [Aldersonia sp. NBC_00410]
MCGRYATTVDPSLLAVEIDALDETDPEEALLPEEAGPNYNVAPTTKVLTVVARHDRDSPDDEPQRRIRRMRWGLVPRWTKPAEPGVPAKGKPLFNARADKAATTPAFRDALKYKRCLVPMDGWFEWLTEPGPNGKAVKTPFFMTPADGSRIYMAGLWSVWRDSHTESAPLLSCTILTTDAVGELARIHDRMPLIMESRHWDSWLDPDHEAPADLLVPPGEDVIAGLELRPVSDRVNSVKNNAAELLEPVDPGKAPVGEQISLL